MLEHLSLTSLSSKDLATQHKYAWHYDTQYNDIQEKHAQHNA